MLLEIFWITSILSKETILSSKNNLLKLSKKSGLKLFNIILLYLSFNSFIKNTLKILYNGLDISFINLLKLVLIILSISSLFNWDIDIIKAE